MTPQRPPHVQRVFGALSAEFFTRTDAEQIIKEVNRRTLLDRTPASDSIIDGVIENIKMYSFTTAHIDRVLDAMLKRRQDAPRSSAAPPLAHTTLEATVRWQGQEMNQLRDRVAALELELRQHHHE